MKVTVIALGNKMPTWVVLAVNDFSKRLHEYVNFNLIEIPLIKRSKVSTGTRILEKEAALITATIPNGARIIALDVTGMTFSSEQLALKLEQLQQTTSHLCFLIGGPEGLLPSVLAKSQESWSLSALTLPHPLVRIVLLETLYRAWSIMHNHPYHK